MFTISVKGDRHIAGIPHHSMPPSTRQSRGGPGLLWPILLLDCVPLPQITLSCARGLRGVEDLAAPLTSWRRFHHLLSPLHQLQMFWWPGCPMWCVVMPSLILPASHTCFRWYRVYPTPHPLSHRSRVQSGRVLSSCQWESSYIMTTTLPNITKASTGPYNAGEGSGRLYG